MPSATEPDAVEKPPLVPGDSSLAKGASFGDYELLEQIARGGMGVVYKARQKSLNRIVALKMLLFGPQASPEFVKRFRAEAVAAASLQHPNIVAIHEVGVHEGQHFFVMDYVAGPSLAQAVGHQPLPARRAAGYLKTIAEAIHYAHQRGILHRDLKPSNVLIDAQDQPRVTDFGLAKRFEGESQVTFTGEVLGSPSYIPPEQALGKRAKVSRQSDVYALGAMLYHLLTGRPPFQGETLTDTLQQVLNTEPVAPRLLNPSTPRDLETICLKCLEKEASRRYPTAQGLAEELGRFLEDKPIQARPVSAAGKLWKWSRRRPALAGMGAALVLSLGLGLTAALWQWHRAEGQRLNAEANQLRAEQNAYAADMNLVQAALGKGDLGGALYLLKAHHPAKGQKDLRGWEWRYFWQLCRSDEQFLLHRYSNSVAILAFSSDGKWLAVRRERGAVALWDTGARKSVVELPGSGSPKALALSAQGNVLAYGNVGSNGTPVVSLWNLTTRQEHQLPHSSAPARLALSPDGTLLASRATDGMVRLWQIESRQVITNVQLSKLEEDYQGRILFSPNGPWLAIGETNAIRLWDWASGKLRTIPLPKPSDFVTGLAFSPDGRLLVAACNQIIQVWDVATVWDLPAASEVPLMGPPIEHRSRILDLAVAPDNQTLATAGVDQMVRLWDLHRRQEIRRYQGNAHEVWAVAFSPDGQHLVSGGRDGSVRYWDPVAKPPPPPYTVLPVPVWSPAFAFAPDGQRFIALDKRDGSASLWETATVRPLERLSFLGTDNSAVKWSPDGRTLALGDWLGNIRVRDFASRRMITNFVNEGAHVATIRFAGGGRSLLCGLVAHTPGKRRSARVWNVADWREVRLPAEALQDPKWPAVSPDNRTFAALDADGTVAWWDLASGRRLARFPHHFASVDGYMAFSPDGRTLACSAAEGLTTLWDVATGLVLADVRGNVRAIHGVAFSPDGQRLLSGGADASDVVRLMDLASRRYVATLPGEPDDFWFMEMSADGNTLVAVGVHGTALLWRAPSWAEIEAAEKGQVAP